MCSILKKKECMENDSKCFWVVGKGCQKIKTLSPKKESTPKKKPSPKPLKESKPVKIKKAKTPPKAKTPSPSPPKPKSSSIKPHETEPWRQGSYGYNKGDDNYWYAAAYSPTSASKCQGCGEKIQKGKLRIARHSVSPFGDNDLVKYYHADHAFNEFIKARCNSAQIKWEKLNGTKLMTDHDRQMVYNEIQLLASAWETKCKNYKPKPAKK